jgi:hypothetical protein
VGCWGAGGGRGGVVVGRGGDGGDGGDWACGVWFRENGGGDWVWGLRGLGLGTEGMAGAVGSV